MATPFFIGNISRMRPYRAPDHLRRLCIWLWFHDLSASSGLGNHSLKQQITGAADYIAMYQKNGDLYEIIIAIVRSLPCAPLILALLFITMVAFYATSFDSIALIGAWADSYHKLGENQSPHKLIELMWCILLILLPIALVFSDSSMSNLQSVSIIAAFPIGAVIVLITLSFLKDAKKYMNEH